jgi:hypothetical protein
MVDKYDTREGWLRAAALLLEEQVLRPLTHAVPPKTAYSCGWPGGGSPSKRIGECWAHTASPDGTIHIFISPLLHEPLRVLDVLLHELVHAVVGVDAGHGPAFKKVARAVGLEGKLTATTVSPGTPLHAQLVLINEELGAYPHGGLQRRRQGKGKSNGGWLRMKSPEVETYTLLISPKSIEQHGLPMDPWGNEMEYVK